MHLSVKLFIWHSFLSSNKVIFVVGQGQWGITKRKECEGYSIWRTKAVSKVTSCYCWDVVWWNRKERQDTVKGWCGESQYQTASVGKFFFREARKLQNICFQEKRLFKKKMILSPLEGNSVTDCDLLQLCLPTGANLPAFLKIKLKWLLFFLNLFEEVPQTVHFTPHDLIEYTGYILSPSQVLLRLTRANMQTRKHVHVCASCRCRCFIYTVSILIWNCCTFFLKFMDEDWMLQGHWQCEVPCEEQPVCLYVVQVGMKLQYLGCLDEWNSYEVLQECGEEQDISWMVTVTS